MEALDPSQSDEATPYFENSSTQSFYRLIQSFTQMGIMKLLIGAAMRIKSSIGVLWICVCMSILTRSESKNTQSVSSISEDTSTSPNKVKIYDKEHIRKKVLLDRDQSLYASLMTSTMRETHVVWADFVLLPKDDNHTEEQLLDSNVSKKLRLCQRQTVTDLSEKLIGADFEWCKWSLSEDEGGGKVKVLSHPV